MSAASGRNLRGSNEMSKWKDDVFNAFKGITDLTKKYDVPQSLVRKANNLQREFEMKMPESKRGRRRIFASKRGAEVVKRDGKYFVSVVTALGSPDVEHPTAFEAGLQGEVGPFYFQEKAKEQVKQVEDNLRKRGQLW